MPEPDPSSSQPSLYERDVRAISGPDLEVAPCRICKDTRVRPVFRVDGIDEPIVACRGCGLARFHPMLSDERIRSFYPKHYYGEPGTKFRWPIEGLVRSVAARHIEFLSRDVPAGGSILDVGCGRGVLLGALADRGFRVSGVELSEDAVFGCDPRANVFIAERLSAAGFESESFDLVVIWHVLEHLADPFDAVAESHRILKPGGRLIVAVPNLSSVQARFAGPHWFHLDPPRHLYHFPLAALRELLQGAGFGIRSTHHFSLRQNPFGWIQSALNRFTRQPTGGLYNLLHERAIGRARSLPARTRLAMWAGLVLGAPVALALSVLASWLRSGATVHVVAERR